LENTRGETRVSGSKTLEHNKIGGRLVARLKRKKRKKKEKKEKKKREERKREEKSIYCNVCFLLLK
jgi:hypothetical protein